MPLWHPATVFRVKISDGTAIDYRKFKQ